MTTIAPAHRPRLFTAAMLGVCALSLTACFDAPESSAVGDSDDASTSGAAETGGSSDPDPSATTMNDATTGSTGAADTTGEEGSSGGQGSTGVEDDTSGTGDSSSTGAEGDTTPPQVVEISPADGASAVIDPEVTLVFDEPVDTATVEAAFPTGSEFVWNGDDSEVTFELDYPFADTQSSYDIVVPTTVTDVAGNALEEEVVSTIALAALHTVVLEYDPDLTGNNTGTWFYAGDTTGDADRFGGATFALGSLPNHASILQLRSATLATQVLDVAGTPEDTDAGGYVIDHVEFATRGAIASPVVLDDAFAQFLSSGEIQPGTAIEVDVTDQFDASWSANETRFQIRVRLADVLPNAVADVAWFRRGADENDGIVHDSVTEPDASHRLRVSVEYFTAL